MADAHTYKLVWGQFRLHEGDKPVVGGAPLDEISLVVDLFTGELIRHGHPVVMAEFFGQERARRRTANPAAQESLGVLTGRIPLDEVNRCLLEPGHSLVVWEKAQCGALGEEPRQTGVQV